MKVYLEKPEFVEVKFQRKPIWLEKDDFDSLKHFREEGLDDFYSNTCIWVDNNPCRLGAYTLQSQVQLVEGGELCPTEIVTHFDSVALKHMGLDRDTVIENWRNPQTGESIRFYKQ